MRKAVICLLGLVLAAGFGVGTGSAAGAATASAAAAASGGLAGPVATEGGAAGTDDVSSPLESKRRELREQALNRVLTGRATPTRRGASTVVKVGTKPRQLGRSRPGQTTQAAAGTVDQYVELSREKTDRVFVILAEFGDQRDPAYPDVDTDPNTPGPSRFDGPAHNEMPQPDRSVNSRRIWQPDYDRQHYQDLYFASGPDVESAKTYYEKQSSGRYSIDGTVTDWVKVPFNEARYGRSNGFPCGSSICNNTWALIRDAANQWVADQLAAGRSLSDVTAELKSFDAWDRYDFDGDGDFNEPDGYIDHFQIIHAGGDQADADPFQGEDAIWSHRWYAYSSDLGSTGPADNKLGGTALGDSGIWIGDYTIQAENTGTSTIVHEYGHDLGLPDEYDTSGPSTANENEVNWWTLMAQSRMAAKTDDAIGIRAAELGAWDKLQLGWLDYEIVPAGQARTLDLGPHEYNSAKAQGVVVVLPRKRVTTEYGPPAAGERMWWSTKGDDLNTTLTRPLDLTGRSTASMTLKARYDIEADFDFLYTQVSLDGGATWTALDGTVNGQPFPRDASGTPALTGSTGGAWADLSLPLTSVAGHSALLRFQYRTDGGVALDGFFADDITVTADGATVFTDGAEDGAGGWTASGFRTTTGTETADFDNYYLASNRSYVSYDQYLATGPYNFGFAPDRPDLAEHFPYQPGLLVSYWDTSQADNNTSQHPGAGLILPVDAHPRPIYTLAGTPWRPRIAGYDAPFSLRKADSFTLHLDGQASYIRGQDAVPLFDDTLSYWSQAQPTASVKVAGAGVRIRVVSQDGTSMRIRIS